MWNTVKLSIMFFIILIYTIPQITSFDIKPKFMSLNRDKNVISKIFDKSLSKRTKFIMMVNRVSGSKNGVEMSDLAASIFEKNGIQVEKRFVGENPLKDANFDGVDGLIIVGGDVRIILFFFSHKI